MVTRNERYAAVVQLTAALVNNPHFNQKGGKDGDRFGGAVEQAIKLERSIIENVKPNVNERW